MLDKAILITDEHIGLKNFDINFYNQQKLGFNEMFTYMKENNINKIFSLGDFFDSRTKIDIRIQNSILKDFFDTIELNNFHITMLVGNHNIYYNNTLEEHNLEIYKRLYSNNVTIIENSIKVSFNDKNLYFVPWMVEHKLPDIPNDIDLVLAHPEINTFNVSKVFELNSKKAINPEDVKVPLIAGHFHSYQQKGNITYLGNSFVQDNWSAYGEKKGFHILNEDLSLEFIECIKPSKHLKVTLDSEAKLMQVTDGITVDEYKINTKTDYSIFTNQILKIYLDKDNAFNKKVQDKISEVCYSKRISILEQDEEEITEDNVDIKGYDISTEINQRLDTNYQQSIYKQILDKSLVDLKE